MVIEQAAATLNRAHRQIQSLKWRASTFPTGFFKMKQTIISILPDISGIP
jgi:hypothetical protein